MDKENVVVLTAPQAVWRVTWNITGTVLTACTEDGTLILWRKNVQNEWSIVQTFASNHGIPVSTYYSTHNS